MMILDGAMGTMIQKYNLTEQDFGQGREGCNDVLVLTRPDVISEIHREYIEAGADIIETNSFNANSISLEEYGLQDNVAEINMAAARLARHSADSAGRDVKVAGSMGPSNVALSLPEVAGARGVDFDVMRQAYSQQAEALIAGGVDYLLLETIFDTLNAKAAIAGIEDAFDSTGKRLPLMISITLTEQGRTLSGQTLEDFVEAILHARPWSVGMNCGFGAEQMGEWLEMLQPLREQGILISLHPNAGLPDELGNYTQTPEMMARTMGKYMSEGMIDIAGGCCGTTPDHIKALSKACPHFIRATISSANNSRDAINRVRIDSRISSTEDSRDAINRVRIDRRISSAEDSRDAINRVRIDRRISFAEDSIFIKVGERCNVAGSRKFLRLVNEGNLTEALNIAAGQIDKGAALLDINMDDAMLDAPVEMERFVKLLGQDGRTSEIPLMIDSSDMEVIRRALKHIQLRPIVNSISLKEGEEKFLNHAKEIRRLGAMVVVMAFDEKGQATNFERRIEICERAYRLLIDKAGFKGEEIIFDPNILTIATGMPEHDRYALDFLEAIEWIKKNLPGARVSGGVSNLSFAFRGNNRLREAMHSIFLEHAIRRGMDMAIVDPKITIGGDIDPKLREAIEDVLFVRRPDATDRLLEIAAVMKAEDDARKAAKKAAKDSGRVSGQGSLSKDKNVENSDSLELRIERGNSEGLERLLDEALEKDGTAMAVVNNRLMAAMKLVGDEFGAGRMFLPQVVRAAGVMKKAIDYLTPHIEAEAARAQNEKQDTMKISDSISESTRRPFVLATVRGDVHDIGKNIVAVILKCGGFDVIDLGVMVDEEKILSALRESGAKFLGLSGLITPSLKEMQKIAEMLEREGLTDVTLCVGGATTSDLHTAVKIAPLFSGLTLHTRDAAVLPVIANRLANAEQYNSERNTIRAEQTRIRQDYEAKTGGHKPDIATGHGAGCPCCNAPAKVTMPMPTPKDAGIKTLRLSIGEVEKHLNWKPFLHTWRLKPTLLAELEAYEPENSNDSRKDLAEARRLLSDAHRLIEILKKGESGDEVALTARLGVVKAYRKGDTIIATEENTEIEIPTPRKEGLPHLALADFVAESEDWIGLFAVTAKEILDKGRRLSEEGRLPENLTGEYGELLLQSVADRLVEAATEEAHQRLHSDMWGLFTPIGIRPAVGYASLPDQRIVFELDKILDYSSIGVSLTENGGLAPSSTTTGLIFAAPTARYF